MSTEIKKQLKKGQLSPVYLLYGTENFLINEIKQEIITTALNQEEYDFNLSTYDMNEVSVETAVEDAETLPFMGEKRVVILKNAAFLTGTKEKQKVEHNLKRLETYINDPVPYTCLIIEAPYEKLDERKKVVKLIKKQFEVLHASPMNEKLVYSWLYERAGEHHITLTSDGADRLLQLLGAKLMLLSSEIAKMALYVGEGGEINSETVDLLVARTLENDIFALVDRVVHRKLEEAFRILYDLFQQNEEPIKIAALLVRQFRIIYHVKELTRRGYSQKQIAATLKIHPYGVKVAAGQAKFFKGKDLSAIIAAFAEADYQMKTGFMDKKLILEMLITKLKND
ncbi:DNA polymerase III subunit delta [Bacillus taeanensis]|uniref:DNA polymerase III subunit delta n=1 Tax=Bacillus taeanensis TaxID=273032 RepID=A0A366XZU1_9BACI|nr:DNA polymerase III subunit delta [Bacillus taeanensis]RBW70645.1 DNA polymerase III subunit delta [Bacillus taeanensis]